MQNPSQRNAAQTTSLEIIAEGTSLSAPAQTASPAATSGQMLPARTKCTIWAEQTGWVSAQIDINGIVTADKSPNESSGPAPDPLVDLSEQHKTAIELLILGKTDQYIGDTLGLHYKTIARWRLYHAGFRAELARRREELWSIAGERFRALLNKAIDVIAEDLDDQQIEHRFRSARSILTLAAKFKPAPDAPIEPFQVLMEHARYVKRSMNSIDPMIEGVTDQEMDSARYDLMNKLNNPAGEKDSGTNGHKARRPCDR